MIVPDYCIILMPANRCVRHACIYSLQRENPREMGNHPFYQSLVVSITIACHCYVSVSLTQQENSSRPFRGTYSDPWTHLIDAIICYYAFGSQVWRSQGRGAALRRDSAFKRSSRMQNYYEDVPGSGSQSAAK